MMKTKKQTEPFSFDLVYRRYIKQYDTISNLVCAVMMLSGLVAVLLIVIAYLLNILSIM